LALLFIFYYFYLFVAAAGDSGTAAVVFKQEVWPPCLADTVFPRLPLITHVLHFVSQIKK